MIAPRPLQRTSLALAGGGAPAGAEAAPCGRGTALHSAAYCGHADAMCALLIAGATEGIKDKRGYGLAVLGGRV